MSRKTPVQAAFLSTLSLRRATLPETAAVVPSRQFLSTLSLRRATPRTKSTRSRRPYFYPRSPCGERLRARAAEGQRPEISIHALLAESDILGNPCAGCPAISIHALLAESDGCRIEHDAAVAYDFYPRSPCGERQGACVGAALRLNFYPRSPCGERLASAWAMSETLVFLSTLSLRRATARARRSWLWYPHFYPRSPCGERRCLPRRPRQRCSNFYPRSPCGERLPEARELSSIKYFYPRSPCGERPPLADGAQPDAAISIHALLAESDI